MTRELVVRPQAEAELDEAAAWYAERSRGLGAEFVRVVDAALAAIRRNSLQFPLVHGRVRRAVIRRFPYAVLFTESEEEIVVLSIFHSRRDPKRWQS
ncbi:MAG TPA: type II toxin-antitoxin system RelE/ParE family toxin [Longimicrobiaceae bacterium]|nr:type II toxin-antitoxin system RelE/ParE family toxin [Longimicrobiaceae bacterium]